MGRVGRKLPWVVEQRRGFAVEASHLVHACAVGADGALLWQVGSDLDTTFRSAAKPFQLEACLALLPEHVRARLGSEDLALGSASHHGEAEHVAQLMRLMGVLGCQKSQLLCGAHEPTAPGAARALWERGQRPDVLHNNCAGKHMFMAAVCAAHGWDPDYRPSTHPLQQAIAALIAQRSQVMGLDSVIDGCGVPCFVLPLSGMARSYAQLALALAGTDDAPLAQVGRALRAHPFLMSGSEAYDGWLIEHAPVVAKVGALGLLCIALPAQGVGLAIKVESGAELARATAVHGLLTHFMPSLLPLLPERFYALHNVVGARVGELVCVEP